MFKGISLEGTLREQRLEMASSTANWLSEFTPARVLVQSLDGHSSQQRLTPKGSFAGHTQQTQWDRLHALYFCSYALWTYLTIPFLYTYPGFQTEELPEWEENGEVWRRLKVTFPESIASHSREQISYFGQDGLLRRHDYTVDVMGGARGANYASNYQEVGGIMVPMTRSVFAYDDSGKKVDSPLLVSIDFGEMEWKT